MLITITTTITIGAPDCERFESFCVSVVHAVVWHIIV